MGSMKCSSCKTSNLFHLLAFLQHMSSYQPLSHMSSCKCRCQVQVSRIGARESTVKQYQVLVKLDLDIYLPHPSISWLLKYQGRIHGLIDYLHRQWQCSPAIEGGLSIGYTIRGLASVLHHPLMSVVSQLPHQYIMSPTNNIHYSIENLEGGDNIAAGHAQMTCCSVVML